MNHVGIDSAAAADREPGHHASDSRARLVVVKALRCASTPPPAGLAALTSDSVEPSEGKDVMPRGTARLRRRTTQFRRSMHMINISTTPSIEVTIGHQTRQYHAFVTTAPAALRRTVHARRSTRVRSGRSSASPSIRWSLDDATSRARRHGWSSSTPPSSLGSAPAVARALTDSRRPIPSWSGSTRCSSGSGSGCRFPWRQRHA